MSEFRGVYPAIITPMTASGDLNEEAFRVVYEGNVRAGAHGFWVAGGTGESVYLTEAENNRVAEIAADQNGGRVKNIMHVGAATTAQAARQAEHAAKAGVEAICAVPPFFYGVEDEAIVEYYRVVGNCRRSATLCLQSPPRHRGRYRPGTHGEDSGRRPSAEGTEALFDRVPQRRNAYVEMGLDCFIGSSLLMAPALAVGAVGCIDGPLCIVPELWVDIWNAHSAGDGEAALAAQRRATEFVTLSRTIPFPAGFKTLCTARFASRVCGDPRPPFPPASEEEKTCHRSRPRGLRAGLIPNRTGSP